VTAEAAFERWMAALEARHLERFTFAEVRKALQALSSLYVERRDKLSGGAALATDGKRAAFALYYAPLHFLLVREVVRRLEAAAPPPEVVVDLGCGTAPAGAAWASETGRGTRVLGYERHGWAASEARHTLSAFGLRGDVRVGDLTRADLRLPRAAIVAAYAVNEIDEAARGRMLAAMLEAARGGARVLVLEPLSRRIATWWPEWEPAFVAAGGRADEWRFRLELPDVVRRLDRAAGLDHREITGRTLYLG
jgi:hypothetical protein